MTEYQINLVRWKQYKLPGKFLILRYIQICLMFDLVFVQYMYHINFVFDVVQSFIYKNELN